MTARGRFAARLGTMLIALAGFVTAGALSAGRRTIPTPSHTLRWATPMPPDKAAGAIPSTIASRAPNGYPYLLDLKMRIDLVANAACTGASTSEVSEAISNLIRQPPPELNQDTGTVTLTVGAADLNLSGVHSRVHRPNPDKLPEFHPTGTSSVVGFLRRGERRAASEAS